MPEMTTGTSPSLLDDFVGAIKSVGKTILSVVLLALVLFLGVFLVAGVVITLSFLWVGHKLRLIKEPPRVKFQRFQAKAMGKFIQWRLAKSGLGKGFGGGNPFGGAAGNPFGERPADAPDPQSIAEAYRQATEQVKAKHAAKSAPSDDPEAEGDQIKEVEAEPLNTELENFHGSLDEYMRMKKGL